MNKRKKIKRGKPIKIEHKLNRIDITSYNQKKIIKPILHINNVCTNNNPN